MYRFYIRHGGHIDGPNKETMAMLLNQNNPQGIEFYLNASNSFCFMTGDDMSEKRLYILGR